MKEIKQALLLGREIVPYRKDILKRLDGEAIFTSIVLIRIAFTNISKVFFSGDYNKFGKCYLGIQDEEYLDALNLLRNALEHNFWTLSTRVKNENQFHKKGEKIYFTLTAELKKEIITKNQNWKTLDYNSSLYIINPRRLYTNFEKGITKLRKELYDKNNSDIRERFNKNVRLKHWILVSP